MVRSPVLHALLTCPSAVHVDLAPTVMELYRFEKHLLFRTASTERRARPSASVMASLTLLANDYQALAKEAGRRHPAVREAAELAHQLLKTSKEQALLDLRAGACMTARARLTRASSADPVPTAPLRARVPRCRHAQRQGHRARRLGAPALDCRRCCAPGACAQLQLSSLTYRAGARQADPRDARAGHSAGGRDPAQDPADARQSPHDERRRDRAKEQGAVGAGRRAGAGESVTI